MGAVEAKYIKNIQGREFITFEGLLDLAHKSGLKEIETDLIQAPGEGNGGIAIVHARVQTGKGVFTGIGDASRDNVRQNILPHLIRMSETRAIARALRWATNVGQTAVEELGDLDTAENERPTDEQIDRIDELAHNPAITDEDRKTLEEALPHMTQDQARDMIDILMAKIQAVEDNGKKAVRKSTRTKAKSRDAAAGNGTPTTKPTESASSPDPQEPDDPDTPANGQAQQPETEEDDGPPATEKQVALITRTVREANDVLTEKEVKHIQALLDAKLSRSKASEVLDYLLGRSVKNPLSGQWERVSQGVIGQRRAAGKAA